MNYKNIILGLAATMLLAGCGGHTHTFDTAWEHDETYHWHKATCEHDEVSEKEEHTFKDEVTAPTDNEDGYTTHTCTVCEYSYKDTPTYSVKRQKELGIIPAIDTANKKLTYGLYPQTYVGDTTTVAALNALTTPDENTGWYLYNGAYYAKQVANPLSTTYKFSDGTSIANNTEYWFKCELIEWTILSSSNGTYSVLSSVLLDASFYSPDSNNYENSYVRSWLNSDFLMHAFSFDRSYIDMTTVDNSADSTGLSSNPYASANTNDRIYLLSFLEYINESSETRKSKTTDYALAKCCYSSDGYGQYMTRSPYDYESFIRCIGTDGSVNVKSSFDYKSNGIRPAMTVKYSA